MLLAVALVIGCGDARDVAPPPEGEIYYPFVHPQMAAESPVALPPGCLQFCHAPRVVCGTICLDPELMDHCVEPASPAICVVQ
jgi:hypothetical protein